MYLQEVVQLDRLRLFSKQNYRSPLPERRYKNSTGHESEALPWNNPKQTLGLITNGRCSMVRSVLLTRDLWFLDSM